MSPRFPLTGVLLLALLGCSSAPSNASPDGSTPADATCDASPCPEDEPADLPTPNAANDAGARERDGGDTSRRDGGGAQDRPDSGRGPSDAGANEGGAPDAGDPLGIDRAACLGRSSSSGSASNVTPNVTVGYVLTDTSSGGLRLVLLPRPALAAGDVTIGLYFTPIPGQLSYTPNGSVGCALLRYTGSGWGVVDRTQLCELSFATIQHASAPGVCDGTLAGTYRAVFAANQPVAGAFVLPSDVAASQIRAPSCRPMNSNCTSHAQCCSQSCSPAIGVCQ